MKKLFKPLCTISLPFVVIFFLYFIFMASEVRAQDIKGKWGIGLRGGASFLTQDFAEDVEGETGLIVGGNILYGLTDIVSLGLNVEWEKHDIESLGISVGDISTASIIPFAEFRATGLGAFSPYGTIGIGMNINSINLSDIFQSGCIILYGGTCEPEEENTFAFKLGGGFDYFFGPNLALNAEIAWKLNSGTTEYKVGGVLVGTDDQKASAFSLLLGARYYF